MVCPVTKAERSEARKSRTRASPTPMSQCKRPSIINTRLQTIAPGLLDHGVEAAQVIAASTCERPVDPVADGIDVTRAEFEYAVTHECALGVDDILDRRTRIGLVARDRERVVLVAEEFLALLG